MNKKGNAGYWLNFSAFFLILLIIGAGIVGGVLVFYGQGYNFKKVESQIILNSVLECLEKKDFFVEGFDIEKECSINKKVVEKNRLILIRDLDSEEEYFIGVYDYLNQCSLLDKNDKFAKCSDDYLIKNDKRYYVVAGSNADSRRIVS